MSESNPYEPPQADGRGPVQVTLSARTSWIPVFVACTLVEALAGGVALAPGLRCPSDPDGQFLGAIAGAFVGLLGSVVARLVHFVMRRSPRKTAP